jgi:hypothetical protein
MLGPGMAFWSASWHACGMQSLSLAGFRARAGQSQENGKARMPRPAVRCVPLSAGWS